MNLDENLLAVNSFTNNVQIFDINEIDKEPVQIQAKACNSWNTRFNPTKDSIYTGGVAGFLLNYNFEGKLTKKLKVFDNEFLSDLQLIGDQKIFVASNEGSFAIVDQELSQSNSLDLKLNKNTRKVE